MCSCTNFNELQHQLQASIQRTPFFSELDAETKQAFSIGFSKTNYPGSSFPKPFTPRQKAGSKNKKFQFNSIKLKREFKMGTPGQPSLSTNLCPRYTTLALKLKLKKILLQMQLHL